MCLKAETNVSQRVTWSNLTKEQMQKLVIYSMSVRERDSYRGTYRRFYQTEIVVYNSQFEQTHTCLHS